MRPKHLRHLVVTAGPFSWGRGLRDQAGNQNPALGVQGR